MTLKAWLILATEILLSLLVIFILYGQVSKETKRADDAESLAKQRQETINDMTVRQRDVAALDAKYTGELADAKVELEKMRADVDAGRKRLQVAATCTKGNTASAPGMDDATSPRLTDAAERNYWSLRERIEIVTSQLTGLQQYIREQCIR